MISGRTRALLLTSAVLAAGFLVVRGLSILWTLSPEDFIYYRAGTGLYWEGKDPYDNDVYQRRLEAMLGKPNPFPSKEVPFLYPPLMSWVFYPFTKPGFLTSYRVFSVLLAGLAGCVWWLMARRGPPLAAVLTGCVLLACPAAENALFTHRVIWLTLAAWLLGMRELSRGRELTGGLLLGLLGVQPQWLLVCLGCLAAGRRWRALGAAAAVNLVPLLPYLAALRPLSELAHYAAGLEGVRSGMVFRGNLSLAAGVYRVACLGPEAASAAYVPATVLYRVLWWGTAALFAGAMVWTWRRDAEWEDKTLCTFALALWVQPYSHGSELLWALPWVVAALRRQWPSERGSAAALAGALLATMLFRLLLDFPGGRGHIASAYLLATFAALAVGRWRAARA